MSVALLLAAEGAPGVLKRWAAPVPLGQVTMRRRVCVRWLRGPRVLPAHSYWTSHTAHPHTATTTTTTIIGSPAVYVCAAADCGWRPAGGWSRRGRERRAWACVAVRAAAEGAGVEKGALDGALVLAVLAVVVEMVVVVVAVYVEEAAREQ